MGNAEVRPEQQQRPNIDRRGLPSENIETLLYKTVITTATAIHIGLNDPRLIETVVEFVADNFSSGRRPIVLRHLPVLLEGKIRRIRKS